MPATHSNLSPDHGVMGVRLERFMKLTLFLFGLCLLAGLAQAQPGSVPGVRLNEPPLRSMTYPPSTDTLPSLTVGDTANRSLLKTRYLAIDRVGLFGKFHRYRIFPGETMAFRTWSDGQKYRYPLLSVSDTAFTIAFQNELYDQAQPLGFPLADVRKVYLRREIPFVNQASYLLPAAGVIFLIADFVNPRSLDGGGRFIFDSSALVPAGLLILGGGVCYKLSYRTYPINKRNRLKVLWTL